MLQRPQEQDKQYSGSQPRDSEENARTSKKDAPKQIHALQLHSICADNPLVVSNKGSFSMQVHRSLQDSLQEVEPLPLLLFLSLPDS